MSDDDDPFEAKRPRLAASTKAPAKRARKIKAAPLQAVPTTVGFDPFDIPADNRAGHDPFDDIDPFAAPEPTSEPASPGPAAPPEPAVHILGDPFSDSLSLPFVAAAVNLLGRPQVIQIGCDPIQVLREFPRGAEADALAHARHVASSREIVMIEGVQPWTVIDALLEGLWLGRSDAMRKA